MRKSSSRTPRAPTRHGPRPWISRHMPCSTLCSPWPARRARTRGCVEPQAMGAFNFSLGPLWLSIPRGVVAGGGTPHAIMPTHAYISGRRAMPTSTRLRASSPSSGLRGRFCCAFLLMCLAFSRAVACAETPYDIQVTIQYKRVLKCAEREVTIRAGGARELKKSFTSRSKI